MKQITAAQIDPLQIQRVTQKPAHDLFRALLERLELGGFAVIVQMNALYQGPVQRLFRVCARDLIKGHAQFGIGPAGVIARIRDKREFGVDTQAATRTRRDPPGITPPLAD